ncbi:MAG: hypothetical protein Fur009_6910 [Candidatus Microgenomates bacterium]
MTDALQVETQYDLPKPEVEISKQEQIDWRPGTFYWQILTGYKEAFSDPGIFFDNQGELNLPHSELEWYYRRKKVTKQILGYYPKTWFDPSWISVQDSLRMYALTSDGLNEMRKRLQSGYQIKEMPNGLGIIVEKAPIKAVVKGEPKNLLERLRQKLIKTKYFQEGNTGGYAFFLDESKFQSPLDVLTVVDEIAKLHPETAKRLYTRYLTAAVIGRHNALTWNQVLSQYPEDQIPNNFQNEFRLLKTYASDMAYGFSQLVDGCAQRLGCTPLTEEHIQALINEFAKRPKEDQTQESKEKNQQRLAFGL